MSSIYVFRYQGYDSEAYLVEADSETEALGKIVEQISVSPVAECVGTLEEVMETSDGVVKLV